MNKKGERVSISQAFCLDRDKLAAARERHHTPDQSQSKPQTPVPVAGVETVCTVILRA